MYLQHWGLAEAVFRQGLDARAFYAGPNQQEALFRLDYLVADRRRLGLVLGPTGSGKSLLLEVFAAEARRGGWQVAQVDLAGLDSPGFFHSVAVGLGLCPRDGIGTLELWPRVVDRIVAARWQRQPTVILLDSVDRAAAEVLDDIVRLSEADPDGDAHATLILASARRAIAEWPKGLVERVELRIDLEPFDLSATAGYLEHELVRGGGRASMFSESR